MELSPEQAKQLLFSHLSKKSMTQKKPIPDQIDIKDIKPRKAYRLTLETEYEVRVAQTVTERYSNQIDETNLGPHPGIWDVACEVPSGFTEDKSQTMRMPGSGKVIQCAKCDGRGKIPCTECCSVGEIPCRKCSKSKNQTGLGCAACSNRGKVLCDKCDGNKMVDCKECRGSGKAYQFEQLKIKWTSKTISAGCDTGSVAIPENKLKKLQEGKPMLEQMEKQILPLSNFPGSALVPERSKMLTQAAAERIAKITKSDEKKKDIKKKVVQVTQKAGEDDDIYYNLDEIASDSRILFQRLRVFEVPACECAYAYKSKYQHFVVFGEKKKVFAPNFSNKCAVM